jgi:hypothetical protein
LPHIGQREGIVFTGEDRHVMEIDISADSDAEAENPQNHGNGLAEAWAAHQQKDQQRQDEIEMLFHTKRPDVGERLVVKIVNAEVFSKGKKLPGR